MVTAVTVATVAACGPRGAAADGAPLPASADTVRGVLTLVGSEPMTMLLQPASGPSIALEGGAAAPLRTLSAVEVTVAGERTSARAAVSPSGAQVFRVAGFVVRAVDGVEASDGVLVEQDGAWSLRLTTGGERRLAAVPAALREYRGARVYVVGPDARQFGLIAR